MAIKSMRRSVVSFIAAILASICFVALAAVTASADSAADTAGCAAASPLLASGDLLDAQAQFEQLVDANPDSPCATAGYQAATDLLAAESFEKHGQLATAADEITAAIKARPQTSLPASLLRPSQLAPRIIQGLLNAGFFDAAVNAYQTALAEDPSLAAPQGLDDVARADYYLALARALESRGLHDQAMAQVQLAIQQDPATVAAAKDVPSNATWWIIPAFNVVWQIGLLILIVVVLAVSIWGAVKCKLRGGGLKVVSTNDPSSSGTGPGFALLLRADLQHLYSSAPGAPIDLVEAWADPITVPTGVTDAIPQTKVISAFIALGSWVLQAEDQTLEAFVQADSPNGPGVTLRSSANPTTQFG